jgi:hypothetical protein
MITMGSSELSKEKLVFGEPFILTSRAISVSFSLYLDGSTEPAANISRPVNDYSKALPEEVIALLRNGGMERQARILYTAVPANLKTAELATKITEARVAGTHQSGFEGTHTSRDQPVDSVEPQRCPAWRSGNLGCHRQPDP